MLATSDLVALIEQNPDGMTTEKIATAFNVEASVAAHRLSRANTYGLISKRPGEQGKRRNVPLWLPKVKAPT